MLRRCYFLLIVVTIVCSSQMFASPREGIYVGVGAGATFDHAHLRATNTVTGFQVRRNLEKTHALGSVFLGYGCTCNCFFLGVEGGTYFPSRTLSKTRPGVALTDFSFRNHIEIQDYFTLDVLPGYRIWSDFLVYVRGGFTVARVELEQDANVAAGVPRFSHENTQVGGRLGVGINFSFCQNWAVGLDYFHTWYPKQHTLITGFDTLVETSPYANYIGVSLIYNFSFGG